MVSSNPVVCAHQTLEGVSLRSKKLDKEVRVKINTRMFGFLRSLGELAITIPLSDLQEVLQGDFKDVNFDMHRDWLVSTKLQVIQILQAEREREEQVLSSYQYIILIFLSTVFGIPDFRRPPPIKRYASIH